MKIEILGAGCSRCKKLMALTTETVSEMGISAEVLKVDQINDIMRYGVMTTPALVVDGQVVVAGRIPSKDEMKKWLSGDKSKSGGGNCGPGCCP